MPCRAGILHADAVMRTMPNDEDVALVIVVRRQRLVPAGESINR